MINIGLILLAYVLGMIPNIYILRPFFTHDKLDYVRSDEVGTYKVFVNFKKPEFFMVVALDFLKGFLLVLLTMFIDTWSFLPMLLILVAVIARNFNLFIGFRNGLGIAIMMGGLALYAPWILLIYAVLVIIIQLFINDLDSALAMSTIVIPVGSAFLIEAIHSILLGIFLVAVVFIHKIIYTQAAAFRTRHRDFTRENPFA